MSRVTALLVVGLLGLSAGACGREAAMSPREARGASRIPAVGAGAAARKIPLVDAGPAATSRDQLARTIAGMDARLAARPDDSASAVTLADALMRQSRVTGNAGLARRAEAALDAVIGAHPDDYNAIRMRASVYLSGHRFRDALREAERARAIRPDDAWNYGTIGDAHLELGDYAEAFDAFDRMAALKPNAASYARVSYAKELQGDLAGALRLMKMVAEATSPQDAESVAWHYAQMGHIETQRGKLDAAEQAYRRAETVFPNHPLALDGRARVAAARKDYAGALKILQSRGNDITPADIALTGEMLEALGRTADAERQFALAEAAWQSDVPEPARLARFLADHNRRINDAVTIAEAAVRDRRDIFTMDAAAWAYFRAGRIAEARAAIKDALRSGSRDLDILKHAAAITAAANAGAKGTR